MFTAEFDKTESKLLNWLRKALTKDKSRTALLNLFVVNGKTVACDGFRIHAIRTPDSLKDYEGKALSPKNKSSQANAVEGFEVTEDSYPNIEQVYPKKPHAFRIGVNPKFLIDALSGFEGHVTLTFYTDHEPFLIKSSNSDNQEQSALIMPVYIDDNGFTS